MSHGYITQPIGSADVPVTVDRIVGGYHCSVAGHYSRLDIEGDYEIARHGELLQLSMNRRDLRRRDGRVCDPLLHCFNALS